jgi:hypothetical protein
VQNSPSQATPGSFANATSPTSPAVPPTPSQEAAQPAKVSLNQGILTVEANNSGLTQILHAVADASGMKIKGLNGDSRLFGVYGPGDVRDVLSSLLVGSGYNFIMVGGAGSSTPQELLLTAQNSKDATQANSNPWAPAPPSSPAWAQNNPDSSDDDDVDATTRVEKRLQLMQEQQQVEDHHLNNPPQP